MPAVPGEEGIEAAFSGPLNPALLTEKWNTFRKEGASRESLRILEPHYERLSEVYGGLAEDRQALRLRGLQLEQAALAPKSVGSNTVLQGLKAYESDLTLHGERMDECRQETQTFTRQLLPTFFTLSPRVNRLKNEILEQLNPLPVLDPPDTTFAAVYSRFVETYGEEAGEESELDRGMNELELRTSCLDASRSLLSAKRFEITERLDGIIDVTELKALLTGVEELKKEYDDHGQEHMKFEVDTREFMEAITLVGQPKEVIIELRKKVNARKPAVREKLAPLKEMRKPPRKFELTFREVAGLMEPQALIDQGLRGMWKELQGDYGELLDDYDSIRRAEGALEEAVESADSMEALQSLETRIQALNQQCDGFKGRVEGFASRAGLFDGMVTRAREKWKRDDWAKRVAALKRDVSKIPPCGIPEDVASRVQNRIFEVARSNQGPMELLADFNRLKNEYSSLGEGLLMVWGLEAEIQRELGAESSEARVTQLEEDVVRYREMVASHNARLLGFQCNSKLFLESVERKEVALRASDLSPTGQRLLEAALKDRDPLFGLVRSGTGLQPEGEEVRVSVADRVAVLKQLVRELPELDVRGKSRSGDNLIHKVLRATDFNEHEKIELIRCLVELGTELNEYCPGGRYPLDMVLNMDTRAPALLKFLQSSGAVLSPGKDLPVVAHLIGTGGWVSVSGPDGPKEVELDGLSSRVAEFFIDPVFKEALAKGCKEVGPPMEASMAAVAHAYDDVRNNQKFIDTLRRARSAEAGERFGPVMLSTGWLEPSGHAIGFVFNQESDGSYLYACNTGSKRDPTRSVVRYQVENFDQAIGFFKRCSRDGDVTRSFYTGEPADFGFKRCRSAEQLPSSIGKSFQKRGNCPVASRKACLLAMLWSVSREEGIEPAKVRSAYKTLTTDLRVSGVNQVLDRDLVELEGKALVSMLTKYDRPECQRLAHQLADKIVRSRADSSAGRREGGDIDKWTPLYRLKMALEATYQDLGSMTTRSGESLAVYARRMGNSQTCDILTELVSEGTPV
ncbi:MAG: hypothetical protein VX699_01040 [Myxococcota bacterium]|nr:hypothetical protein [Myxococcota bacterium]